MTITSKYNGKCKQCGGHIGIGNQVEWQKGEGIRHTKCPAAVPPRPSGERAGVRGQSFRPVPKPGQQQARRSYPPKVAAQIVPGTPGPYHGKFRRLEGFLQEAAASVGHAELDAEHAAIMSPRPAPARTTVTLHTLCPTRTA